MGIWNILTEAGVPVEDRTKADIDENGLATFGVHYRTTRYKILYTDFDNGEYTKDFTVYGTATNNDNQEQR